MRAEWKDLDMKGIRQRVCDKLTTAGELVASEAMKRSPVITGNLRGSITSEVNEQELTAIIGTPVEYAPYVEFGTGEFATVNDKSLKDVVNDPDYKKFGKGKTSKGQKARPFLRPALIESKDKIKRIFNAT
jgi:HK97 gp10 family phage protein